MKRLWTPALGVQVLIVLGLIAPKLVAQELFLKRTGNNGGDFFGVSPSFGGDSNGDGRPDVVVGALGASCSGAITGKAYLLVGHDGSEIESACGSIGVFFGASVAGDIDVNQDGIGDFIVGASADNRGGTSSGSFAIYSGADGSVLRDVIGNAGDELGYRVRSTEDLDGDGVRDYAASAIGYVQYVSVYSGASGILLFTLVPSGGNQSFGDAIAVAGDVNGDGIADLLVGDPVGDGVYQGTGRVWVFSGADGSILYALEGEQVDAYFGDAIDGIGDVDQDGYSDFIVGAPRFDVFTTQQGKIYVYSGKSGTLLYSYLGFAGNRGTLGGTVAGTGDVNRDGYPDFLAVDGGDTSGPREGGAMHLYSGRNGLRLYHWEGAYLTGDGIGGVAHGTKDVDGDGRLDLLVGSGDDTLGPNTGAIYIYSLEEFYCDASPKIQKERATITVQMSQTNPGSLVGLALVAIDGAPTFSFLAIAAADSLGRMLVSDTVPRGWANHDIDLQSYAIGFTGKVVAGNVEHVEFIK